MSTFILILFLSVLWYLVASIKIVTNGTVGLVSLFGRFRRVARPGLRVVWFLVERIEVFSTQTHQKEYPGDPEEIDRVNDMAQEGKKLPFRIPQKGMREALFYMPKKNLPNFDEADVGHYDFVPFNKLKEDHPELVSAMEEEAMHAPLTSEVAVVVEWELHDEHASFQHFLENIKPFGDRTREEEVEKRIEDMVSRMLLEVLGRITPSHAAERTRLLGRMIEDRLKVLVGEPKPWGIDIRDVYVKSVSPGHTVNKRRAEAASSVSDKLGKIRAAEAEAQGIELVAKAKAKATEIQGKADKKAKMAINTADADRIKKVIKPAAENELTVRAFDAEAYRYNEKVTVVGATPMVSVNK